MSTDLLTVVTCTLGDAAGHLNRQAFDLRTFTNLPFRQIVSDDGTLDDDMKLRQQGICKVHSPVGTRTPMQWTENPGPVWGISYNLNHALSLVETPWVFLVEDGLRPGRGWLETAVDAIERIGNKEWLGHKVGIMGCASFEQWQLAMAGVLPGGLPFLDFWAQMEGRTYGAFWGSAENPNWNDGLWCWKRMMPRLKEVCADPASDAWPNGVLNFRHVVRHGKPPPGLKDVGRCPARSWPMERAATYMWSPGAFAIINMEAWREVGRFRDGCSFFEGHLGARLNRAGYLGLALEFPPWLHYAGMGFVLGPKIGRTPRHHEWCDGDNEKDILWRDFGRNGPAHAGLDAWMEEKFPMEFRERLNAELAEVQLYMDPLWSLWL